MKYKFVSRCARNLAVIQECKNKHGDLIAKTIVAQLQGKFLINFENRNRILETMPKTMAFLRITGV